MAVIVEFQWDSELVGQHSQWYTEYAAEDKNTWSGKILPETISGARQELEDKMQNHAELTWWLLHTHYFALAELQEETYSLLLNTFTTYALGELKGSTLSCKELESGADCKPHHFQDSVKIKDEQCKMTHLIGINQNTSK